MHLYVYICLPFLLKSSLIIHTHNIFYNNTKKNGIITNLISRIIMS